LSKLGHFHLLWYLMGCARAFFHLQQIPEIVKSTQPLEMVENKIALVNHKKTVWEEKVPIKQNRIFVYSCVCFSTEDKSLQRQKGAVYLRGM
jgi:hypothetical protein